MSAAAGIGSPMKCRFSTEVDLHVEARQPERAAGDVERRREPAPVAPRLERPVVDQDAGRDAERDQVGERVVLDAEASWWIA